MHVGYVPIGEGGVCGSEPIFGPSYCTEFRWEAPDLTGTNAQLIGYNVYSYQSENNCEGMEIPLSEGRLIAYTTGTYLLMEFGSGSVWVTAVYSNPDGESEPSNIACNYDLVVSIKEVKTRDILLTYNKQRNGIEIKGTENVATLRIFCLTGFEIPIQVVSDFINTQNMKKGVYIVKVTTKDNRIIIKKLILLAS